MPKSPQTETAEHPHTPVQLAVQVQASLPTVSHRPETGPDSHSTTAPARGPPALSSNAKQVLTPTSGQNIGATDSKTPLTPLAIVNEASPLSGSQAVQGPRRSYLGAC